MNKEDFSHYGPYTYGYQNWHKRGHDLFLEQFDDEVESIFMSYDFLSDYSKIHNLYSASTAQPNPFSNKVMFIIDMLTKMEIKYRIDIFSYEGNKLSWGYNDTSNHKLVNIVAEPNPEVTGAAIVFCAHHDVANVNSANCQDNGASVCNLLRLASLIKKSPAESKRTIILFSDCEESSARGANYFAKNSHKDEENPSIINHNIHGQIESVINLELTGKGDVIWTDCSKKQQEEELHQELEAVLGKSILKLNTPPNDAIAFRKYNYRSLCIGILPEEDLKDKETWRLCHSLEDTLEKCNKKEMEDFTHFLLNLTRHKLTDREIL